jgi:phage-related baseplate assembly protein
MPKKVVPIRYTSRDFDSIRQDLVNYAKKYYPDTFKDFNEASFGSLMIDSVSYVGDILSYYFDYQANESFLDTAIEYGNIQKIGSQLGYKQKGSPSITGKVAIYYTLPVLTNGGPDFSYAPVIKRGTKFSTVNNQTFTLISDVVTNQNTAQVIVASEDAIGPTSYAVKVYGDVISGESRTETITVGDFIKFRKIKLAGSGISEILSMFDSNGNEYFEVDYISQNLIYKEIPNRGDGKEDAPSILKPLEVFRRFVVSYENDGTYIQFGASSDAILNDNYSVITEPSRTILQKYGKPYVSDEYFDPSKLLENENLGIGPSNTTLQIVYRENPLSQNVAVSSLSSVLSALTEFVNESNLSNLKKLSVINSIEVENEEPIVGSSDDVTSDQLKIRIKDSFGTQNRIVTMQDYQAFCYMMPSKYGVIRRAKASRDTDELKRNINLYVISQDSNGYLTTANQAIKNNLKTWINKNRMINDTVDIIDAKIVNFKVEFSILTDLNVNKYDVLNNCIVKLKDYFKSSPEIGESIFLTEIYKNLLKINGVVDVRDVKIKLASGSGYSSFGYNFDNFLTPDGKILEVPDNVIMELKYPDVDIKGKVL